MLELFVEAAEDSSLNPNNLECFWYGPWNVILTDAFKFPSDIVIPQLSLSCSIRDRDGRIKSKRLTPDFVVTRYKKESNTIVYYQVLIVEIKRFNEDLEDEMKKAKTQLEEQARIIFIEGNQKTVFGIVAIGRSWRYYKFSRSNSKGTFGSWSNRDYFENNKEDILTKDSESKIMDILDIKKLTSFFNEVKKKIDF
jgi:hypothetical protein